MKTILLAMGLLVGGCAAETSSEVSSQDLERTDEVGSLEVAFTDFQGTSQHVSVVLHQDAKVTAEYKGAPYECILDAKARSPKLPNSVECFAVKDAGNPRRTAAFSLMRGTFLQYDPRALHKVVSVKSKGIDLFGWMDEMDASFDINLDVDTADGEIRLSTWTVDLEGNLHTGFQFAGLFEDPHSCLIGAITVAPTGLPDSDKLAAKALSVAKAYAQDHVCPRSIRL